eukprot:gb/GFBE01043974.1/.p1 GENE.gb/GFBE01043974.1/~~gb/GFBE01043974.1/.p1  ORF type:complete len:259 (+),score=51.35 gb/GFBE01043974.1/:1-777(+)
MKGDASVDARYALIIAAFARLAVVACNFKFCQIDGCTAGIPCITDVANFTKGRFGALRYVIGLLSVWGSDVCNVLLLAHASWQWFDLDSIQLTLFQALLLCSALLDSAQAAAVESAYHWVLIQLAGFLMCLTVLGSVAMLWLIERRPSRTRLLATTFLFSLMCVDLLVLLAGYHKKAIAVPNFVASIPWQKLEYLALLLYTCTLSLMATLLPPARLKLQWPPSVQEDGGDSADKLLLPRHRLQPNFKACASAHGSRAR